MCVRIDAAGDHELVGSVEDARAGGDVQRGPDLRDELAR